MSIQKSTRRGSQPFQLRLDTDLREAMEEAQKQDGDESLAGWMKRIIRKELKARGIEPKG
ncbi:hypothetical protein BV924_17740 [Pectobacterium odoriferum]|uniref:Phage protein n=1 Tax=Pectobacterium odoriferum TaxID=78398 RepID=A0ABD6VL43_9GAMM|nr:hypothetical protein [Pectobacterium odoriferum]POD93116.1 hypothetical protein BVY06_17655 [Pectobacterium odoriferum]POE10339.1 hypothetical protein BV924_17740 [Pectobacterium odoriferum]POE24746.1 hypothetical protein BV926_17350 [Pectobacterium odoriferum]POE29559.1 hypothetical protein BV919_17820 [Pectobacterium odoriferum]POE38186.1 hypothetical protein BV920_18150 [Pectobacterium odoriferum]